MATKTVGVKVGNRRLLKLAEFLRSVPRRRFNFAYWVDPSWDGTPLAKCNTQACALGWATAIPSFHARGLNLDHETTEVVNLKTGTHDSIDTAMEFFGVTQSEATWLFAGYVEDEETFDYTRAYPGRGDYEVTPKMVAKTIEKFVKNRSK